MHLKLNTSRRGLFGNRTPPLLETKFNCCWLGGGGGLVLMWYVWELLRARCGWKSKWGWVRQWKQRVVSVWTLGRWWDSYRSVAPGNEWPSSTGKHGFTSVSQTSPVWSFMPDLCQEGHAHPCFRLNCKKRGKRSSLSNQSWRYQSGVHHQYLLITDINETNVQLRKDRLIQRHVSNGFLCVNHLLQWREAFVLS